MTTMMIDPPRSEIAQERSGRNRLGEVLKALLQREARAKSPALHDEAPRGIELSRRNLMLDLF